jgi:hypothetical protein
VVALAIHASRPLHGQFECTRSAGEYIRAISRPEDRVLTNDRRVYRYAGRPGRRMISKRFVEPDILARLYLESEYAYVAVRLRAGLCVDLSNRLRSEVDLHLLRSFPSSGPDRVVCVYRTGSGDDGTHRP